MRKGSHVKTIKAQKERRLTQFVAVCSKSKEHIPAVRVISFSLQLPELDISERYRQGHAPVEYEDSQDISWQVQQNEC